MLSGGYGELKEKLIRLGHMGPASRSLYPLVAVSALGRGLIDLGVSVDPAPARRRRWNHWPRALRGTRGLDTVKLTPFRLHRPETVEQASDLLTELGLTRRCTAAARSAAGGEARLTAFTDLIDVKRIEEFAGIDANGGLRIGATTTHRELERSPVVARPLAVAGGDGAQRREHPGAQRRDDRRQPLFRRSALGPGHLPDRRGARLTARRGGGAPREIAVEEFARGPYRNALGAGELLAAVESRSRHRGRRSSTARCRSASARRSRSRRA